MVRRIRSVKIYGAFGKNSSHAPANPRKRQLRIVPDKAKIEPLAIFSQACGRSDALYYDKGPARALADSLYAVGATVRPVRHGDITTYEVVMGLSG